MRNLLTLTALVVLVTLTGCADPNVGTFSGPNAITVSDGNGTSSTQTVTSDVIITSRSGGYTLVLNGSMPCTLTASHYQAGFDVDINQVCHAANLTLVTIPTFATSEVQGDSLDMTIDFTASDGTNTYPLSMHMTGTRQ